MIKLSVLSPSLLYSAFFVNNVVYRLLSVSYWKFKQQQWLSLQQRVHNVYITSFIPRWLCLSVIRIHTHIIHPAWTMLIGYSNTYTHHSSCVDYAYRLFEYIHTSFIPRWLWLLVIRIHTHVIHPALTMIIGYSNTYTHHSSRVDYAYRLFEYIHTSFIPRRLCLTIIWIHTHKLFDITLLIMLSLKIVSTHITQATKHLNTFLYTTQTTWFHYHLTLMSTIESAANKKQRTNYYSVLAWSAMRTVAVAISIVYMGAITTTNNSMVM